MSADLCGGVDDFGKGRLGMRGPAILARTMSVATTRGTGDRAWQYHSRSDNHSKVACWTVLFDFLLECDIFRAHVERGLIGFGINHVMVGPINKTLDLVVTRISPGRAAVRRKRFGDLVDHYGIVLDQADQEELAKLPVLEGDIGREDVSEVVVALEAKACMTEHGKSLPRLHAEILATGYLAKRAQPRCITVSYSMVNAAGEFVTPSGAGKVNRHSQPEDARKVVRMLGQAIPLARDSGAIGYDVIGVTVVDCRNDGSPVTLVAGDPAPDRHSHINYDRMIVGLCSEYRARFGN
ncbi:MAG TPA: hypothetical protein PKD87_00610 [Burkholderiaceae bacterium]|jgi:hypothetical protein|nr:hypothetical protein [Burkholderiaceae bacterium]